MIRTTTLLTALLGLSQTRIRSERDLRLYVLRTGGACILLALCFDILNQLVFFETWQVALRSWVLTIAIAAAVAIPLLSLIGRAHLDLHRTNVELERLSRTDPLTGLLNRRALLDEEPNLPQVIALVIVDIDRFKRINDHHGHLVGDEVIRAIANVMSTTFEAVGRVGRVGGEEFAILSIGHDGPELLSLVESFRDRVSAMSIVSQGASISATISAGLATRMPGQSFNELYAAADRALYIAKAAGRNRVVMASDLPEPFPPQSPGSGDRQDGPQLRQARG